MKQIFCLWLKFMYQFEFLPSKMKAVECLFVQYIPV